MSVKKGVEAKTCPHPAGADEGNRALANVFLNYNLTELTQQDVFPIGPPLPPPTADELREKASRVAKARKKLESGEKLRIGFWGDSVTVGSKARVSAAGGLGGDTQGHSSCPPCAQKGGTCDDCGGGGGGGIVAIKAGKPATLNPRARFDVSGAVGGTCSI